jgi:hypothetical protein
MKMLLIVFLTTSFSICHASTKREVSDLLRQTEDALLDTQADSSQLDEVAEHIRAALITLGQEPGSGSDDNIACLEFAVAKYKESGFGSNSAMDMAVKICASVKDNEIMKFAFDKYKESGYGSNSAMDMAAKGASLGVRGKLELVKFAFDKYKEAGYGSNSAMDMALAAAAKVKGSGMACVTLAYTNYKQAGYGSNSAMDMAVKACQ